MIGTRRIYDEWTAESDPAHQKYIGLILRLSCGAAIPPKQRKWPKCSQSGADLRKSEQMGVSRTYRTSARSGEGPTTPHTSHRASASRGKAKRGTARRPPPPQKKKGGGGRPRENSPQPPNRPPTTQKGAKPPTQRAPKTGPPNRHRGTTQPKPATPSQEQRPTGKRGTETSRKKKASSPARKKGDGGRGNKARDRDTQQPEKKSAKNTTLHPSQGGRGEPWGASPRPSAPTYLPT